VIRHLLLLTSVLLAGKIQSLLAQTPRPVVTSFKVMGKEMKITAGNIVHFSPGENSVAFDYALPGVNNSSGLLFAYKLEGFDEDWIQAGNRQYVNYTNLYGGDYSFRLKVAIGEGGWYEMGTPVKFHISTAFYNSAWFLAIVAFAIVLVAGFIIYFAYRTQLHRLLAMQKVRNSIASDLHDDIGSSLSSIMLMSEMAGRQPELAASYHSQISEDAKTIIENMNDIVWAINPDNDSLSQIVVRMQSFAANLLEKKSIALQFESAPEIENLKLGMKERRNFYLIFKEAIHNAVKYSSCNQLKTSISASGNMITCVVSDNGKGFDTSKSYTGNGLRNLDKRAREMNGNLQIISTTGKGTMIILSFKTTHTGS